MDIDSIRQIDKGNTVDYDTYLAIKDTGIFSDEELARYTGSNKAERAVMLKQKE